MAISAKTTFHNAPDTEETLSLSEQKEFYTPGEVARMFGVTARTVANWCDLGRLLYVSTL
ncbi:MAG: helix-turn-helix domain-containing protein, partial [Candidatus Sericytochromatia bacterium]|nr:helix-turn-helix domain-containing protein [Candidatus Sericytochromatia bacterium]